jgi:hypothetical protein
MLAQSMMAGDIKMRLRDSSYGNATIFCIITCPTTPST